MTLRVLIAVTHLLGAGHLVRATALGRALAQRGHGVTLVSGGAPMPLASMSGIDLVQLPPVHCRVGDFSTLLRPDGAIADATYLDDRRRLLLSTFARLRPDVVVTEHFPFGRRSLAGEFQALLDAAIAAAPPPLVLASVRDILVAPTKPDRVARTHALVARRYGRILVHGDETVLPLERSWPVDEALRAKLIYTGYVGPDATDGSQCADDSGASFEAGLRPAPQDEEGRSRRSPTEGATILVSGGSSAASLPLYRAALAAASASELRPWHVLIGPAVDDATFAALQREAPPHATVERARPDFRNLMARAAVFVGQAGYNTVMDIFATGARSVLVPFEQGRETEQRLRAEALAATGQAVLLTEDALTPASLLAALDAAAARPRPTFTVSLRGQDESARIIERLASAPRQSAETAQ